MTQMVAETCTNVDCEEFGQEHLFPPVGARVRTIATFETREPGTDGSSPITVQAGEEGIVIGYVVEWHDVHVALITQDGQDVWVSWDLLELT